MSNNCCPSDINQGSTILQPIIIEGSGTDVTLNNTTLTGGVTLDDATKTAIATQICGDLTDCIESHVSNGTFDNVTLNSAVLNAATLTMSILSGGAQISGPVQLDATAVTSLVVALCDSLKDCIINHVENNPIVNGHLQGVLIDGPILLDDAARTQLASQLCDDLFSCIVNTVTSTPLTGVSLVNPSISGSIVIDNNALNSLVAALQTKTFNNLNIVGGTFTNPTVNGAVTLDSFAASSFLAAIQTALKPIVDQWIATALLNLNPASIGAVAAVNGIATNLTVTGGTANNITLNGSYFNNGTGVNNTFTGTTLVGPTTVTGQIPFDSAALAHVCAQLQPCITDIIDNAFDPAYIASIFRDCTGVARAPGTMIPSCADMNYAIELAINNLGLGEILEDATYDPVTKILTLTFLLSDGTTKTVDIDLSSISVDVEVDGVTIVGSGSLADPFRVNMAPSADVPDNTTGSDLPTTLIGEDRNSVLATPFTYLEYNNFLIPAYQKP